MMGSAQPVGDLLREWRQRRRLSQLDLALRGRDLDQAPELRGVGAGAAVAAKWCCTWPSSWRCRCASATCCWWPRALRRCSASGTLADPALGRPRARPSTWCSRGTSRIPALAVDRHWTMVAANGAVARLVAGADPSLLQPPVNVLRLSLHPKGVAPRIANLSEWRGHLLERLRRQVEVSADPVLVELLKELRGYPAPAQRGPQETGRERRSSPAWSCRCSSSPTPAPCRSSRPRPCSARPSTSPCRSWRWRPSFLPTRRPRKLCRQLSLTHHLP